MFWRVYLDLLYFIIFFRYFTNGSKIMMSWMCYLQSYDKNVLLKAIDR